MADGKRGGRCSVFLPLRLPVAHLEGFLAASLDATGTWPRPPPWLPQRGPVEMATGSSSEPSRTFGTCLLNGPRVKDYWEVPASRNQLALVGAIVYSVRSEPTVAPQLQQGGWLLVVAGLDGPGDLDLKPPAKSSASHPGAPLRPLPAQPAAGHPEVPFRPSLAEPCRPGSPPRPPLAGPAGLAGSADQALRHGQNSSPPPPLQSCGGGPRGGPQPAQPEACRLGASGGPPKEADEA